MNLYKKFAGILIASTITAVITASAQASQTANAASQNPRVVIRLMVEDRVGYDKWFLCVIKTELLKSSEQSMAKKPWARCEIDTEAFRYRFAIARERTVPSAFFFYARRTPILPSYSPANVALSGVFTVSLPQHDGTHYWRLSGYDPLFVMYITPFANEEVLQQWLSQLRLIRYEELNPIVGPHPKD